MQNETVVEIGPAIIKKTMWMFLSTHGIGRSDRIQDGGGRLDDALTRVDTTSSESDGDFER